ncbi:uncharacterized protein LOC135946686 isoform X2 [Cloeon dipterum]|uniref:uncharacterized protein LOC135946686 isoform X2 n=1 Tax=Cloeon dipterum TaxID=197152 RepID=UPI00321F67DE
MPGISKDYRLKLAGQFWTSGRDTESCRGKLRWCTRYLNDFIKKDIVWKAGVDPKSANNSCVYIDFGDPSDPNVGLPSLGLADCSEKKKILCEAVSGVGYKSMMHSHFCRLSFNVKEDESNQIWETGDFTKTSFRAKQMIQCLAEHIGIVYNSTKINDHVYFNMMSRMFFPIDEEAFNQSRTEKMKIMESLGIKYSMKKNMALGFNLMHDLFDDHFSAHFQLATDMINSLFNCRSIEKKNQDIFAFDFLQCLLKSNGLDRFWNSYNFQLEPLTAIPAERELVSDCQTFRGFLQSRKFCIPPNFVTNIESTSGIIYVTQGTINIKKMETSSVMACLDRRGSLPYATSKEEFELLYLYFRGVAPNLIIIWDQAYASWDGTYVWCRSDVNPLDFFERVAVPSEITVNGTTQQSPMMLISLPGPEPNLHAAPVTEELLYEVDVFCRFPSSVVAECKAKTDAPHWEF